MKLNNKHVCLFLILFITLITSTAISAAELNNNDNIISDSVITNQDISEDTINDNYIKTEDNLKTITKDKNIKQANRYTYFNYYTDSAHSKEYENNDLNTIVGKEESLYITVENSMSSSSPLTTVGNVTLSYQDTLLGQVSNPGSGTQPITFSFDTAGTYVLTVEFITASGYFDGTQEFTVYVEGSTPTDKSTNISLSVEKTSYNINETFPVNISMQPTNATGTVTIYLDKSPLGQLECKSNDFGVNIALPYAGSYDLTAKYSSNNTNLYEDSQTTEATSIMINPIDTVITVNPITIDQDNKIATIKLEDVNSNPVKNQKMDILIYGLNNVLISNFTTEPTDENGDVEVEIPTNLDVATYNVIINYNGGEWKTKKVSDYTNSDDLIHEASTAQTTLTVMQTKVYTQIEMIVDDIIFKDSQPKTVIINTNPEVEQGIVTIKKSDEIIANVDLSNSNSFELSDNVPSYYYPYSLTLSYNDEKGEYVADNISVNVKKKTYNSYTYFNYYADNQHEIEYDTNSLDTLVAKEESLYITVENSMSSSSPLTAEGNITVSCNGEIIDTFTNPNSGNHEVKVSFNQLGTYILNVEFETESGYFDGIQEFTVNVLDKIPTKVELSVENITLREGQTKSVTIITNPEIQQGIVTVKKSEDIITTVDLSNGNTFDVTYNSGYYYPITLTLSYEDSLGDYKADNISMKISKKTLNSNTYFNYYADNQHSIEYDDNSLNTTVGTVESLYVTVENSYSSTSPLTQAGTITVTCDGEVIDTFTNPNSGNHEIQFSFNQSGTYTLEFEFSTSSGYFDGIQEFTVYVLDKKEATPITILVDDINGEYGQTKTVTINTNPEVNIGLITIKDQEETIATVDLSTDNTFEIELTKITEGSYSLTLSYFDITEEYVADDTTLTINIEDTRKGTIISMDDVSGLVNKIITLTAKVTDSELNNIQSGKVTFTDNENNVLGEADVIDSIATITITYDKEVTTQITASYKSNDIMIKDSTTQVILTVTRKLKTTILSNEFNLIIGQKNNLTVNVIDENNDNVTNGKVVFKINGKTIKDSNGKVIYVKVVNGIAILEDYEIPDTLVKENLTISVVYSGNTAYESSKTANITVNKISYEKTLSIEEITDNLTAGSTMTIKATVTSKNPVNSGKIIVKLNGKTIKDSNGKVIYANVVNGSVTLNYNIPDNIKSKDYNLTVIYSSSDNERITESQIITIN